MVNLKFSDKCDKDEIIDMTRAGLKEKKLSLRRELNPWPPKHQAGTLSTELREHMESEAINPTGMKSV